MSSKISLILFIVFSLVACNHNSVNQSTEDKSSQKYRIQSQTNEKLEATEIDQGMNPTPETEKQEESLEPNQQPIEPEKSPPPVEQNETPQSEAEKKTAEPIEQEKTPDQNEGEDIPEKSESEASPNAEEDLKEEEQIAEGNDPTQKEEVKEEVVDQNVSTFLPFDEFRSRWNAISEMYTGENYVRSIEHIQNETDSFYRSVLNNKTELQVYVNDKNFVKSIKLIGKSGSNKDNFSLITSWWQLLLLSNPEMTDFDGTFSHIGVGPNANLTNVKEQTFSFGGITYRIIPESQNYTFEAVFP